MIGHKSALLSREREREVGEREGGERVREREREIGLFERRTGKTA